MKDKQAELSELAAIATEMQDLYMVITALTDLLRKELGDQCTPEISTIMDKITDACDQARQIVRAAYENATGGKEKWA